MDKKCIFCGEKPKDKNKEHILPQWLIKLTGETNRSFYLGTDWIKNSGSRNYSADQFQFPACRKCNERYSHLEVAASTIINKFFNAQKMEPRDIDLVLDWFDKVRVGFWIGYRYLEKDFFGIDPRFYIDSRIGRSDRVLFVYHLNDDLRGITFNGINSPIFFHMPNCFSLRIKNLLFINISNAFLISRRVGFPYPQKIIYSDSGDRSIEMGEPLERIIRPILKHQFIRPDHAFFQPVIPFISEMYKDEIRSNEYLQKNMINMDTGKGQIVLIDDNFSGWLSEREEFEFRRNHDAVSPKKSLEIIKMMALQVHVYQLNLYEEYHKTMHDLTIEKERKMQIRKYRSSLKKLQNILIDRIKRTPPEKIFRSKNDVLE